MISKNFSLLSILLAFALVGLILVFANSLRHASNASLTSVSDAHLAQIALALKLYREEVGHLPEVLFKDTSGKFIHSWRVAILPQLGYKELYESYNFNEAWDGPNNRKLFTSMPDQYKCPFHESKYLTPYLAVKNNNSTLQFNTNNPDSIIVIELTNSPVNWLSPDALSESEINNIRSHINHEAGIGIIRADMQKERIK